MTSHANCSLESNDDYAYMMKIENSLEGRMIGESIDNVHNGSDNSGYDYAYMLEIENSLEGNIIGGSIVGDEDEQWFLEEEWEQTGAGETVEDMAGTSHIDHAVVSEKYKQQVKRFRTTGTAFDVRFQNLDGVQDVQALARDTIQHQINEARQMDRRIALRIAGST